MCGRVILLSYDELLHVMQQLASPHAPQRLEQLDLGLDDTARIPRDQARPGSQIVALAAGTGSPLEPRRLRWGFDAPWQAGKLVYNTRIESALRGEGMWASAIEHGRCILPVAAFFEPHATQTERNPHTGRTVKRPYLFARPDATPLLLGSISDSSRLSVVTTEPNADVVPIHRRMPLVLEPAEARAWLEGDLDGLADRSRFRLDARPEHDAVDNRQAQQQTLF